MYYFIINPASGSGKGRLVWKTVRKELERSGVSYRSFLLAKGGEARALAAGLCAKKEPVTAVIVGGDGTINDFISGLSSFENLTLGCIPTGSGNDFVRGLGLPRRPLDALHAVLHPKRKTGVNIGCALCEDRSLYSFVVSAGLGYDAAVCASVQESALKTLLNRFHSGKLVYLLTALWQLLTMKRCTLQITADDGAPRTFPNAYFAAAMNLRFEGGGFMFCPDALPGDGMLDLFIASDISRLRALMLLPMALSGKHVGKRGIHILRCKKAALLATREMCLHTDGETPGLYRQVTFCLREEKLPVILG